MASTLNRICQYVTAQARNPTYFTAFLRNQYELHRPNTDIATEQHLQNIEAFLLSRNRFEDLLDTYHKGELSFEEHAERIGFKLPQGITDVTSHVDVKSNTSKDS
eukprot:gene9878-2068_t